MQFQIILYTRKGDLEVTTPIIPDGYILLSRKLLDSEIMKKPPLYFKVWIWLLMKAQYKDYGNLKRGQLFTSIAEIQEAMAYYVGYRKVKPSKDQIWNVLEWLRNPHEDGTKATTNTPMITTTKTTRGLIITIEKYDFYQDPKNYESNNESNDEEVAKKLREQQQADTINKNDKNNKNKEDIYNYSCYNKQLQKIIEAFNDNIHPITPIELQKLGSWLTDVEEDVVVLAIEEAVKYNKRNLKYIESILKNWTLQGLKTKESVEAYLRDWKDEKGVKKDGKNIKSGERDFEQHYKQQGKEDKLFARGLD